MVPRPESFPVATRRRVRIAGKQGTGFTILSVLANRFIVSAKKCKRKPRGGFRLAAVLLGKYLRGELS